MKSERGPILILLGPLVAIGCVALSIVSETGSGLFVAAIMSAVGYMLVPPVIQIILLATQRFAGRHLLACGVAMGVTTALLSIPYFAGLYNAG